MRARVVQTGLCCVGRFRSTVFHVPLLSVDRAGSGQLPHSVLDLARGPRPCSSGPGVEPAVGSLRVLQVQGKRCQSLGADQTVPCQREPQPVALGGRRRMRKRRRLSRWHRGWWGGDILPESPALGAGREGRAEPSISQQGGARPFLPTAPCGAQTTGVWEGR